MGDTQFLDGLRSAPWAAGFPRAPHCRRALHRPLAGRRAGGRPLEIEAPLGTFCYHEQDYRPLVMVATGTGLAPIKAMLESLLDDDECPPVSLYWGMRTEADLYLR